MHTLEGKGHRLSLSLHLQEHLSCSDYTGRQH